MIERTIPLWGILTVVGSLVVAGALVWSTGREQAVQIGYLSQTVRDLNLNVRDLTGQLQAKNSKDQEQDGRLNDYGRRLLIIEAGRDRK